MTRWFFIGCALLALSLLGAHVGSSLVYTRTPLSSQVIAGHAVWIAQGCESCHSLAGQGGTYAPDLTHIVAQRGIAYLHEFFVNPAAFHPGERPMPRLNITRDEIDAVLAYLQVAQDNSTAAWVPVVRVAGGSGGMAGSAGVAAAQAGSLADAGQRLYSVRCASCHALAPDVVLVGPTFWNIASTAATRVPGQDAETYLRNAILYPGDYIVEGYQDVMQKNFGEVLSSDDIAALIAYLMTLRDPGSAGGGEGGAS
jgi:mono/diheme cytochrome c family protein